MATEKSDANSEKEIVVSGRGLLTLLAVVVVLLGVFFAVGYKVGQSHSSQSTTAVTK